MKYYKEILLLTIASLLPLLAFSEEGLVECPKTVFPNTELGSITEVGQKFVGCDSQFIPEAELCKCAQSNATLLSESPQKEALARISKEESKKAWTKSYKKEFLNIAQSLFDLDAMTKNNIEDAAYLKDNLSPTCNISSILSSLSAFGSSEGCDQDTFKNRVKEVFGSEDLSAIQKDYSSRLSRLIENQVPSNLKSDPNICLPYSTYNYSKNLNILNSKNKGFVSDKIEETVVAMKVAELNGRCTSLQGPNVSNIFCKKELPDLPLDVYQASVSPALSSNDSFAMANLVSARAYCNSEGPKEVGSESAPAFNVENTRETDFETFINGEGGDYQKFNQSVCKFLPECDNGQSTDKSCRNILNLRQMTLSNLEEKIRGIRPKLEAKVIEDLIEKFAYDPESILFDSNIAKVMDKSELADLKGFLAYLNNFIIDKANGNQTLREMAGQDSTEVKNLKDPLLLAEKRKRILKEATFASTLTPIEKDDPKLARVKKPVTQKPDKPDPEGELDLKAFNEKRRLSAAQFNLNDIEDSELAKKFLEGPAVQNPTFVEPPKPENITPTNVVVTPPRNAPSVPARNVDTQANLPSNDFIPPTRRSSNKVSNSFKPSSTINSPATTNAGRSFNTVPFPSSASSFVPKAPSSTSNSSSGFKSASRGKKANQTNRDLASSFGGGRSLNNEISRYKNVIGNLPSDISSAPTNSGPVTPSEFEQAQRKLAGVPDGIKPESDFEKEETSKKGKGTPGTKGTNASNKKLDKEKEKDASDKLAAKGKKGLTDKNGKFTPQYMYKYVLPHLIVDVFGVEEVVKKYNLYGKRFHTLEITDEETFILHTYDFESSSVPFVSGFEDQEYNLVRLEILEQVQATLAESRSSAVINKILENTSHREERVVKTEVEQIRLSENMIPFEDVEKRFAQN
ncbi:MAG: hypothetical protein CME70_04320 [Halobacteriovorax sp.]|nr:hypothetical protein [Halobacteriovorax sp.]|tara:strand:- start:45488 stop:48223 length:2736 start_codon:yes stop_codon:yes gene_type:complete